MLVGAGALAAGAQATGTGWDLAWTPRFIASLIGLVVFGTALWYYLLARAPLNRLNTFTFLTPVFSLLLGGLFFGERFSLIQIIGIFVTILGIQLVAIKSASAR